MKLMGQVLLAGIVLFSGFANAASQAGVEGVLEIPVNAGQVELKAYSKISGGVVLNLDPVNSQSLSIKCHQGFGKVTMMVFLKGNALSQQLTGSVESQEACEQELRGISEAVLQGADTLRIEVRTNHTLGLATSR
ncbi:hypothetical protein ACLSU7_05180 [Bdellovibrio sp. HCB185ZH]|uniref:hypothetical protein n=1 Tax=Bdellovibrio sp. HCB185ZH TaxID=3394235 RepID=UPI0039A419F1